MKKVEGSHRSVYNWHAFNKEGQRLLTTEITRSSRNLDTNVVFWGDVSSIRVQVATGRRMVVKPFALNMAGVSDEKMAQYQKQYDQFQEMVMTAEKVKNAVKKRGGTL